MTTTVPKLSTAADGLQNDPASFRDPSGFVFFHGGRPYRQINRSYAPHYEALLASGLHGRLEEDGLLIPHETVPVAGMYPQTCYRVIAPEVIPFISYPYEWCFSELKDAALATLRIQKKALTHGLTLKDANAYNIQFYHGRPTLIDTLSFEKQVPGAPWAAYGQFCRHFLAPLALMAFRDDRLGQLMRVHMDGIPLDLASSLLPRRTYLAFGLSAHLHLHAKSERRYADGSASARTRRIGHQALIAIIDSLISTVDRLKRRPARTEWGNYYEDTNYSDKAAAAKKTAVAAFLQELKPASVWDLGANSGRYSRLAAFADAHTVAFDNDPEAVEAGYLEMKTRHESNFLPLYLDLANPAPGQGWAHTERKSLEARGPADAVMALALVHHLAITHNLPLASIASYLSRLGRALIIEFVPKNDSKVRRLLASRPDIFPDYDQDNFEKKFSRYFTIRRRVAIDDSERVLYLMEKRGVNL